MEGSKGTPSQSQSQPQAELPAISEATSNSMLGGTNATPTLEGLPQETRDLIFSYILPERNFQTCSERLCNPKLLGDSIVIRNGIDFSIRSVNRNFYEQCLLYMYKNSKIYIDPHKFYISLPVHTHPSEPESVLSLDVLGQIKSIFITDKHLRTYSQHEALPKFTGVRTIDIEHDMTQTPMAKLDQVKYIVGEENLELSDRQSLKSEIMALSIAELSALHEKVWSEEKGAFLCLRELLSRGLAVSGGDGARGLRVHVHVRCPKCQCPECVWARADPEGGDSTVTVVYDWNNQVVLDTFWV